MIQGSVCPRSPANYNIVTVPEEMVSSTVTGSPSICPATLVAVTAASEYPERTIVPIVPIKCEKKLFKISGIAKERRVMIFPPFSIVATSRLYSIFSFSFSVITGRCTNIFCKKAPEVIFVSEACVKGNVRDILFCG